MTEPSREAVELPEGVVEEAARLLWELPGRGPFLEAGDANQAAYREKARVLLGSVTPILPAILAQERERWGAEREDEVCDACEGTGIYHEGDEWAPCESCSTGREFRQCLEVAHKEAKAPLEAEIERLRGEIEMKTFRIINLERERDQAKATLEAEIDRLSRELRYEQADQAEGNVVPSSALSRVLEKLDSVTESYDRMKVARTEALRERDAENKRAQEFSGAIWEAWNALKRIAEAGEDDLTHSEIQEIASAVLPRTRKANAEVDDLCAGLVPCDNCEGTGFYEEGEEWTPCTVCGLGERIGHRQDIVQEQAKAQALAELREALLSDDVARRVWEADRDSGWKLLKGLTYRDRLQAAVRAALQHAQEQGGEGQ